MSNSAMNFTVVEASTNITTFVFNEIDIVEFNILGFSSCLVFLQTPM